MMKLSFTSSQKGSALLNALVVTGVLVAASGVIYKQSLSMKQQNRYPRIKSTQMIAEASIKSWVMQPVAYENCGTGSPQCALKEGLEGKRFLVRNAKCPQGQSECGFVTEKVIFDPSTSRFTANLRYEGTEFNVPGKTIELLIPPEVLHSPQVVCPSSTPIFLGLNSDGSPKCRALPGTASCGSGEYSESLDLAALSLNCRALSVNQTCAANQLVSDIRWAQGSFQVTCAPRTNVFTFASNVSNFSPRLIASGAASVGVTLPEPPEDAVQPQNSTRYEDCAPPPPPPPPSGACGGASAVAHSSAPNSNLCAEGTASTVTELGTSYTWTCTAPSTPPTNCSAAKSGVPLNGQCGSAHNQSLASAPPGSALCSAGVASTLSGSGPWTWTCAGLNNGADASCTARRTIGPIGDCTVCWRPDPFGDIECPALMPGTMGVYRNAGPIGLNIISRGENLYRCPAWSRDGQESCGDFCGGDCSTCILTSYKACTSTNPLGGECNLGENCSVINSSASMVYHYSCE